MTFNYKKIKSFLGNDFVEKYVQPYMENDEHFEIYDDGNNKIYYISKDKGIDYLFESYIVGINNRARSVPSVY